jgi:hypothetical protein
MFSSHVPHLKERSIEPSRGSFSPFSRGRAFASSMVSGYSICATLIFLISSGDRSPNWISLIVFSGALEYWKLRFAMMMDPMNSTCCSSALSPVALTPTHDYDGLRGFACNSSKEISSFNRASMMEARWKSMRSDQVPTEVARRPRPPCLRLCTFHRPLKLTQRIESYRPKKNDRTNTGNLDGRSPEIVATDGGCDSEGDD